MHPILAASVIALALTLERLWFFRGSRSADVKRRFERIEALLLKGDEKAAMKIAGSTPGPIGKILEAGLTDPGEGNEISHERMAICGEVVSRDASRGLSLLALISPISTMLGLLGTVIGLVLAFQRFSQIEGTISATLLASGIWVALITTVAGMLVAIPSLIAHHYLQSRLEKLTFEIEHYGSRLLLLLKKSRSLQGVPAERHGFDSETEPFRLAYQKGRS